MSWGQKLKCLHLGASMGCVFLFFTREAKTQGMATDSRSYLGKKLNQQKSRRRQAAERSHQRVPQRADERRVALEDGRERAALQLVVAEPPAARVVIVADGGGGLVLGGGHALRELPRVDEREVGALPELRARRVRAVASRCAKLKNFPVLHGHAGAGHNAGGVDDTVS